jgi:hypothetical protein
MTASFVADSVVRPLGLDARLTADPTAPVVARLDRGLPVAVAERQGDWARIVCANGWEAWVDGRLLTPLAPTATARQQSGLMLAGVGLLSLLGAVAVGIGGFLDWWKVGASVTAWDIPMKFLVTGDVGDGVKAGPFLLVVVLVALPLVTRRPLPSTALLVLGAVPALLAVTALIRGVREDPSIDPRIGLVLTLAGGVLIMIDGLGIGARAGTPRQ